MYRKYKKLAHMACLTHLISQSSLEVSPIWIPLISKEISQLKRSSAVLAVSSCFISLSVSIFIVSHIFI